MRHMRMLSCIALATVFALAAGCAGDDGKDVVRPDDVPPGGWWDEAGWRGFLDGWSREALALLAGVDPKRLTPLERDALAKGTLAEPGATTEAIAALETRLGKPLPPSYKAFLRASGGWSQLGMDATDGRLWPPAQVRWFKDQEPDWLKAWTSVPAPEPDDALYFTYGPKQDPVHLRRAYLPTALAVSEGIEAAIYLLNPRVRSAGGEWEAWFFGNELPGATRYTSFQALMLAERPRVLGELRAFSAQRRK